MVGLGAPRNRFSDGHFSWIYIFTSYYFTPEFLYAFRVATGPLVKCGRADRVKRGPYLQTRSAFYPCAVVTNEVCFAVYKPVKPVGYIHVIHRY